MKRKLLYQWIVTVVVTVGVLLLLQIADAVEKPSVREGREFRELSAGADYKPGELLVRFAPKAGGKQRSRAEKKQVLTSLGGGALKRSYKLVPGLSLVKLPPGLTVNDALKTFNNTDGVLYAGPNYRLELMSTFPNDPCFSEQWGLHNTGQTGGTEDADIDAPEAWDIATDANDVIVAVIDSGIDYDHPDLAANIWINEDEQPGDDSNDGCPGLCGVDDDGDGLIDEDSNDFEPGDPNYAYDCNDDDDENGYNDDISGWNFYANDSNNIDEHYKYHGTFIAGIIGAIGDNNEGIAGVCWNVKLMNLRVHGDDFEPNIFISNAIEAVDYAVDNGAKVLNNSYGLYVGDPPDINFPAEYFEAFKESIDAAGEAGVLFVSAAGNEGQNNDVCDVYPQNYDCNNIIVVMATDQDDKKAGFSNYGANTVDLGAPGEDLYSCKKADKWCEPNLPWICYGSNYQYGSGTSYAAPHVAGAAALIWAVNPYLSYQDVKDILLDTVDVKPALEDDPDPDIGRTCVTGGRLNLYKALQRASLYPGTGGFCVKSDSGEPVARFDESGNLFLKGILTEDTTPDANDSIDEFRFQDSDSNDVAIIDSNSGDMYISGWLYYNQGTLNPQKDNHFIIKDSNDDTVAYIDDPNGDLYLKGKLYENPE